MNMWNEQMAALTVMSEKDTLELIEQNALQVEVRRIQTAIDYGTVWQDARDGQLAAGFISSGLCRERR